jgi:hypothetical protein
MYLRNAVPHVDPDAVIVKCVTYKLIEQTGFVFWCRYTLQFRIGIIDRFSNHLWLQGGKKGIG